MIVTMCVMLLACGKKKETLTGTWKNDNDVTYIFNKDGTGQNAIGDISMDFTYEATETDVKIIIEIFGQKQETTYKYTIEDKKLTLESGVDKEVLTKVD